MWKRPILAIACRNYFREVRPREEAISDAGLAGKVLGMIPNLGKKIVNREYTLNVREGSKANLI